MTNNSLRQTDANKCKPCPCGCGYCYTCADDDFHKFGEPKGSLVD